MMSSESGQMGKARFSMSFDLLIDLLRLPDGTEIETVVSGQRPFEFDVYVRHPDLPEVEKGNQWPEACPVFKSREPIVFVEWGIDEK